MSECKYITDEFYISVCVCCYMHAFIIFPGKVQRCSRCAYRIRVVRMCIMNTYPSNVTLLFCLLRYTLQLGCTPSVTTRHTSRTMLYLSYEHPVYAGFKHPTLTSYLLNIVYWITRGVV